MPIQISTLTYSDAGRVRERNEDSAFASAQGDSALLIVADGMGGYRAGDRASELAVAAIRQELEPLFGPSSAQPTIKLSAKGDGGDRTTVELPETAASEHYGKFLTHAVRHANEEIVTYGQDHREARGLGSTVTMAVITRNRAYFANVGDSRSYLYRNGTLRVITRDHSLVAKLVEAGEIEPDEVYVHPKRNLIYRSLGADHGDIDVDLFEEELQSGDIIFLCSDGLWEKIRSPQIIEILQSESDLLALCQRLISTANEHGGEDNITVAIARYSETADVTPTAVVAERASDIADADTGEMQSVTPAEGEESR